MPNSNNYLEYFMLDKNFKITLSNYVSYLKNGLLQSEIDIIIIEEVSCKMLD